MGEPRPASLVNAEGWTSLHTRRLPALDGMRGVAFLLVAMHNFDAFEGHIPAEWLPAVISHMGWIGVQIFFVLSGFLITDQLIDGHGKERSLRSFYLRRAFRILPLYYLALVSALILAPLFIALPADMSASLSQQRWLWLLLNNWTQPFHGHVIPFSHFWSLAVEEQFYLVWPFIVLTCLAATTGARRMLHVCAALVVLALLARCIAVALGLPQDVPYMFTICRMDALAIGAAANVVFRVWGSHLQHGLASTWILVGALLLFVVTAITTNAYYVHSLQTIVFGYPVLGVVTAAIMLVCAEKRRQLLPDAARRLLCLAPLRSIGKYSYAMYIVHLPLSIFAGARIRELLDQAGLPSNTALLLVLLLLSYILGALSYLLVERHLFALRDRLAPRASNGGLA
jgi:peptidoglycan/LPS O-acetylase OafA/YrhL